jgi:CTP:molybdopterin cytidylyltransferase MocA
MDKEPSLAGVLLAAGPSTRLGQPKQLVEVAGESLVRRTARLLLALQLDKLMVVTGCDAPRVEAEVAELPLRNVRNRDWAHGMGESINCGTRAMMRDESLNPDGVLIAVCDQWRLQAADLERLVATWKSDISRICVACWKEESALISGPPVIFPRKLIPELKAMQPSRGARQLIDRHIEIAEFVSIPNAAFDLDRPEDLERL